MSSGVETSLTAPPDLNKRFLDFARNDKDVCARGAVRQEPMNDDLESKIEEAIKNPRNLGEMKDADAIGTVGSVDCGDMLRMWIKFKEQDGRKIIDRATFQSFGCQTAIAVASVATEMLKGKTAEEAKSMSGEELSAPLGALPPVKIHCAQLVEGALRNALGVENPQTTEARSTSPTLAEQLSAATQPAKVRVVFDK
jgi:nitrogen fixation NifU-like protein